MAKAKPRSLKTRKQPKPPALAAPIAPAGAAEKTKQQGSIFSVSPGLSAFSWSALWMQGDFETYREMRKDPTIAMARAAATAPIKAADYAVQADDDAPADAVQLIQDMLAPIWRRLIKESCQALDYGFQAFEKIWAVKDGALTVTRVKALMPDLTDFVIDPNGNVVAVRNTGVDLRPDEHFVYTYDGEFGNPYGRSRNENIRKQAWNPYRKIAEQSDRYFAKSSGIIPLVRYPNGENYNAAGALVSNGEIAQDLVNYLSTARGITMPQEYQSWAEELIRKGINPADLLAWSITFLETPHGHGQEFTESMRYYDSLKMRGWLVPERAATEGQFGTKAEAESHADVGIGVAQETYFEIVEEINRQIVDHVMAVNYGPEAVGKVYVVPTPMKDRERELARKILESILTNPGSLDLVLTTLDIDAMLDREGLPKVQEVVLPQTALPPTPPADPTEEVGKLEMAIRAATGLALDCGTGYGGFKQGNDCAGGGGGGTGSSEGGGGGGSIVDSWTRVSRMSDKSEFARVRKSGVDWVEGRGDKDGWGSLHNETQSKLKAEGINEITAYRGVKLPDDHPMIKAIVAGKLKPGQTFSVDGMRLQSYSEDKNVAARFASTDDDGMSGVVLERVIPRKHVVAGHRTQKKFFSNEKEIVAKTAVGEQTQFRLVSARVNKKVIGALSRRETTDLHLEDADVLSRWTIV